jgi:capsular polysaccharide biosynthesis protein
MFMIVAYRIKNWLKKALRNPLRNFTRYRIRSELTIIRLANRLLPFLNIEAERLYPPATCCTSTVDWISQYGTNIQAEIRLVDAAYTALNRAPKTIYEQVRQTLSRDKNYACPQTFVASIPSGRVLADGIVITPNNQLLDDVSVTFRAPSDSLTHISRNWSAQRITEIDGTVAVLATYGASLYYHWIFQLLPRFELIRRAGISLETIDYFLVSTPNARFQHESLEALAINDRIIHSSTAPHLRARKLVVPSIPLGGGCFAPWMCEFLRRTFLSPNDMPRKSLSRRRIYIPRGTAGYRRVLNEAEVLQFLNRFGFEPVSFETLTVRQQAAAMAACDVVIAPHGGGLSNLVFCSSGTKVIEIFSPELVAAYYWKLSNQLGLDYYYVLGKGPSAALEPDYSQSWDAYADIEIDLPSLEKTLVLAGVE